MKKIITKIAALTLIAVLSLTLFTGCGTSGEFDNTKEITVVTREEGSGTRDAFVELTGVLVKDADGNKTDNTTTSAVTINSTEAVLTSVQENQYAIGYVSLGSLRDTVKALSVDGVACTAENIKNGTYAIARPFNIATKNNLSEVAQDFIDYILSADGQAIVEEEGYVAVTGNDSYNGSKPSGKITIAGSSSVSPLMEKLKEAYMEVNTNATIEIQTNDSSTGVKAAIEGTCEIGMASRDLKDEELAEGLVSTTIAKDGIAVVVNNANSMTDISVDKIMKIYTGEVKTWADLA